MSTRTKIGLSVTALLLLSILVPKMHTAAFSSNQSPAIQISPSGGLAFDPAGNLWVADMQNSRVLGFMAPFRSNMTPSIVLGQQNLSNNGGSGWYANQMTYPTQVAFDQHGNLWVADTYNSRVIEFIPPFHSGMNASLVIGQKASFPGSVPMPDWSSTVPRTTRNGLNSPNGIAFDKSGDLWIVDSWNGRVLEFQPPFSNNMDASLVIGERDFTTSCNPETRNGTLKLCGDSHTLNDPIAIAFDATGNLWVTDTINLGTYASPQRQGRLLEFRSPFQNGMNASLVVREPAGTSLAFDPSGNLWLCSGGGENGNVSEYIPPLTDSMKPSLIMRGIDTLGDSNPFGLAFDSAGNLWVEANHLLAFNSQMHQADAAEGRVYFENDLGLLTSLSAFTATIGMNSYPYGLFNFTIQGLPAAGSVKLTITFPSTLPSGIGWANVINGNPLTSGTTVEWSQLPASQVEVNGNNMTLTLTNASQEGVISVTGGPALSSTTASATSPNSSSSLQQQSNPSNSLSLIPLAIVIMTAAFALYRKLRVKSTGER